MTFNTEANVKDIKFPIGYTDPGEIGLDKNAIVNNTLSNMSLQNSMNMQSNLAAQQQTNMQQPANPNLPVRPVKNTPQQNNNVPFIEERGESSDLVRKDKATPAPEYHNVQVDTNGNKTIDNKPFIEESDAQTFDEFQRSQEEGMQPDFKGNKIPEGQIVKSQKEKNRAILAQNEPIKEYLRKSPADRAKDPNYDIYKHFNDRTLKRVLDDLIVKTDNNRTIPETFDMNKHLYGLANYADITGTDPEVIMSEWNGFLFTSSNNDLGSAADQIDYFELTGNSLGPYSDAYKEFLDNQYNLLVEGEITSDEFLNNANAKKAEIARKPGFLEAALGDGESQKEVRASIIGDAVFGALGMAAKPLGKTAGKLFNKFTGGKINSLVDASKRIGKEWIDKHPGIVREAIDKLHLSKPVAKATNEKFQRFADNKIFESAVASGNYNPVDNEVYDFLSKINNRVDYDNLVNTVMKKKGMTESDAIALLDRAAERNPNNKWAKIVRRGKYASNIDRDMASMFSQADSRTFGYLSDELRAMNREGLTESLTPSEFNKVLSRRIHEKALKDKLSEVEASKISEEGINLNSLYDKYFTDPKNLKELEMEMYQGAKDLDVNDPAEAKTRVDFWLESMRDRKMGSTQKGEAFGREYRHRKSSKEDVAPNPVVDKNGQKIPGDTRKGPLVDINNKNNNIIPPLKGAGTGVGGELGKELDDFIDNLSDYKPQDFNAGEEVTVEESSLNPLGKGGDDTNIPYRGPKLEEPLTWEGREKYRDVYDTLSADIKAAEGKGTVSPEEAEDLEKRATMYNSFIRSIQNSPLNDVPGLIDAVEKAQGKVKDYSTAGMPKTWIGAYMAGEFGDPESKDAKRTLRYFALNSLGNALMNMSAVIQKRAPTENQWNRAQGVRLEQGYKRYDTAKTKALENNLDSIAKAMNMTLDQKNKVADLINEGDIKLLYDKLSNTKKLDLLERVARFAPYYSKLSDKQRAMMAAIMMDSGISVRDELGMLKANFSDREIAELIGNMKNAEYLNKMYGAKVTQKQVNALNAQIEQALQSAKLTKAQADLYKIKVYAELASHGVEAALKLLEKLIPGGND